MQILMLSPFKKNANIIVAEHKPAELMQRLMAAHNEDFTIRPIPKISSCDSCNNTLRERATSCWACGRSIADNFDGFVVKLAKSGLDPHGFAGSLLAAVNPASLNCKLYEDGNGTRLEIRFAGGLTLLEITGSAVSCVLLSWLVFKSLGTSHFIASVVVTLFFPIFWILHRRAQEKKLLEFMQKRLPSLLQ